MHPWPGALERAPCTRFSGIPGWELLTQQQQSGTHKASPWVAVVCVPVPLKGERLHRWLSGEESACDTGEEVWSLRWGDPLEKGMATHSSILPWRIPWTEEPGRLQSMGVGQEWIDLGYPHWKGQKQEENKEVLSEFINSCDYSEWLTLRQNKCLLQTGYPAQGWVSRASGGHPEPTAVARADA